MSRTSYFPDDDPDKPEIPQGPKLSELPGLGAARLWGERMIADIRACIAGTMRWEDLPPGALISGPPGTGKTMFASALAAELRIPIIITGYNKWLAKSGNDICAAIVADFERAKSIGRCIIFIDEIDSIPSRTIDNHNTTYFTPINNTLLKSLEPANLKPGIIVIAATNHPDRIDEALKRSGRLDHHLEMRLPDTKDLEEILAYHLKADRYRLGELGSIAVLCVGKSGADIAKLVRDARSLARRAYRDITRHDLITIIEQDAPKLSHKELKTIAFHEAGHAIAVYRLNISDDISVSLLAPKGAGGIVRAAPKAKLMTEFHVLCQLIALLAGRAAEQKFCDEITSGSGGGSDSDIAKATELAIRAYDDLSLRNAWHGPTARVGGPASEEVIRQARALFNKAYDHALELMDMEREFITAVACALMTKRALSHADIVALDPQRSHGGGTPPPLPAPPVQQQQLPHHRPVPMNDNFYPPAHSHTHSPFIPPQQWIPQNAPQKPLDLSKMWREQIHDDPTYNPPDTPEYLESIGLHDRGWIPRDNDVQQASQPFVQPRHRYDQQRPEPAHGWVQFGQSASANDNDYSADDDGSLADKLREKVARFWRWR